MASCICGVMQFPEAQDQAHVAAQISHKAVEIVDDILYVIK